MKTSHKTYILLAAMTLLLAVNNILQSQVAPESVAAPSSNSASAVNVQPTQQVAQQRYEVLQQKAHIQRKKADVERQLALQQTTLARQQANLAQYTAKSVNDKVFGLMGGQPLDTVMVIPAAETTVEKLAFATEDMNIMCRIFDKVLQGEGLTMTNQRRMFFPHNYSTKALYLEGYGPVFTIAVNFPLSPPAEIEQAPKEATGDELWRQMQTAIRQPYDSHAMSMDPFLGNVLGADAQTENVAYDERKIKKLKETVITTLKYIENIRNLQDDEYVTIAVKGLQPSAQKSGTKTGEYYETNHRNHIIMQIQGSDDVSYSILTLKAKKSDIHDFAMDKLSIKEFTAKVAIFSSYAIGFNQPGYFAPNQDLFAPTMSF